MRQVILASQSKQRLTLMQSLGIPFEVVPADIDEKLVTGATIQDKAKNIALAKASKVAADYPDAIIIAADTFTYFADQFYEKPANLDEAREMLSKLSGQKAVSYTGLAYLDSDLGDLETTPNTFPKAIVATTTVYFRTLIPAEIERYININPVLTWAAGYSAAYPSGASLIESIEGSLTGFTHGFPMEEVLPRLQKSGIIDLDLGVSRNRD